MLLCFFFNDTATTEIYTLSLHDALPILVVAPSTTRHGPIPSTPILAKSVVFLPRLRGDTTIGPLPLGSPGVADRKSTRLNSSHANISYAVFCLKKKKKHTYNLIYACQYT